MELVQQKSMDTAEYENAIAYLSEQLEDLKANQSKYYQKTEERLEQWTKVNEHLAACLESQTQENRESLGAYQTLIEHLLELAQTTRHLTASTSKLDSSSETLAKYLKVEQFAQFQSLTENSQELRAVSSQLAQYLIEEQAPQLTQLVASGQQLQASAKSLDAYLKEEQSKRMKMLEQSLRAILDHPDYYREQSQSSTTATSSTKPQTSATPVESQSQPSPQQKSRRRIKALSFDKGTLEAGMVASAMTALMLLIVGGSTALAGRLLTRSVVEQPVTEAAEAANGE